MNTNAHLSHLATESELRNQLLSYEAATEGIVLLENNGVLPLSPCKIALYGSGAQYTHKGGSGSGEVNVRHNVTILEGLEKAGFEIASKDWINRYDTIWKRGKERFLHIVRKKLWWPTSHLIDDLMAAEYRYPSGDLITEEEIAACNTDTCFYVISRQSGEGHDIVDTAGGFRLDEIEERNIRLCAAMFDRFILLINTGTPIDLSPIDRIPGIDAVVYMGQLGMEGGNALAAILTGEHTPSGKLAVTWPQRYADVPFGDEFAKDPEQAFYKEGIYVGYRYYDSFGITPRYPFGYGLSYTTFAIKEPEILLNKDLVICRVCVTNTGPSYSGKESVQIYVRCPGEDREYQRLVAYGKTATLDPGASETLTLSFPVSALSCYDAEAAQTVVEAGQYLVLAGASSRDTQPVGCIRIPQKGILSQHKNLCAAAKPISELRHSNTFTIPESIPTLILDPNVLQTRKIKYIEHPLDIPEQTRAAISDFTTEDFIKFCTGTGMSGEKEGFHTPGAVGHTTAQYIARGIPNAEMCDGPAGVRIEKRAVLYPDGRIRPMDVSISIYEFFPKFLLRWLVLGNPKKGTILYQYVTGFPIEAMIAQTWNTELAERIGHAVSQEMREYGVSFWLAPAMNIVRNPLCGRNYEYYSEDPLLSGLMASAVTKGVQAMPGNYATVKHFCANNQETNRYSVSSEVDERALREIYWKGFEIVIANAQPEAVMTAYNKVNGTYCANNKELCTDLLRHEWGFEGVVMTDWMSTGKDRADEAKAIRAGVNIIMPGGEKEVKTLQKAYQSGELLEADIRRAAIRVINAVLHTFRHLDSK